MISISGWYNLKVNSQYGLLIGSFLVTLVLFVPFINLLYKLKFTRKKETDEVRQNASQAFYDMRKKHAIKVGVPTGGGILVSLVVMVITGVALLFAYNQPSFLPGYPFEAEVGLLLFTFAAFGILGFYDDIVKIFGFKKTGFFGLRMRHKLILQTVIAFVSAAIMYWGLKIDFVFVPGFGIVHLGIFYFFMAAFLIVTMANAFDITDGLDGLSCGLLFICLLAFWAISAANLDGVLLVFMPVWIGALIAFLYFNIYPARIMLGNMGGLAFGATLAVVGLLSGKIIVLLLVAGLFLAEGGSSMVQLFSKKFMKRRIFPIAPFHHWLELIGWEEPKIVARAWLAGLVLAIFGLWLAFL